MLLKIILLFIGTSCSVIPPPTPPSPSTPSYPPIQITMPNNTWIMLLFIVISINFCSLATLLIYTRCRRTERENKMEKNSLKIKGNTNIKSIKIEDNRYKPNIKPIKPIKTLGKTEVPKK